MFSLADRNNNKHNHNVIPNPYNDDNRTIFKLHFSSQEDRLNGRVDSGVQYNISHPFLKLSLHQRAQLMPIF